MLKQIQELGLLPVIKIDDAQDAPALAKALIDGDLPAAEVTFRTKAAKEAIKLISQNYPDMLIGAGTVLTTTQVDEAVGAGAKFIISPGLNPKVVEYCKSKNVPIFPGINNPSSIEQAIELGLDVVKFFPAEASGGLKMLKAMAAPYTQMKFMPTGGIDASNLTSYLDFDKIVACGGSWMVPNDALAKKDFATITKLTKEAVMAVHGFKFGHIGMNNGNASQAEATCKLLSTLFGYSPAQDFEYATFMGKDFEVMKKPTHGRNGHFSFVVNNIDRAVAYLSRKGIKTIESSVRNDDKGKLKLVYLDLDINGFAVHLTQK